VSQSPTQHSFAPQPRWTYLSAYTCLAPSTINRERPLLRLPKRASAVNRTLANFDADPILTYALQCPFLLRIDAIKNRLRQVVTEGLGGVSYANYIAEFIEKMVGVTGIEPVTPTMST